MYVCMYVCPFSVLSCVGRDTAMGPSPVQEVLQKCLKGFIVLEVNSVSEQAPGPKQWNEDEHEEEQEEEQQSF